ncbi:MAG: hypothetical protein VZQ27_01085 [Candidatus Cryptobacteroides sp.]|nr:hypothetical protein [Candidatus Cryptobacteroides sp.]
MKKIILITICGILALCSCSKNSNEIIMNDEMKGLKSLETEIVTLNSQLQSATTIDTKAKWWRYLLAGAADLLGGCIHGGNVATGIAASTFMWTITKPETIVQNPSGFENSSIYQPSIALEHVDLDGEIHNNVIINILEKNGEGFFEMSEETMYSLIIEETAKVTGEPISSFEISQEQKKSISSIASSYVSSKSVEDFMERVTPYMEEPEMAGVVRAILEGYEKVDALKDNGKYETAVGLAIDNSNIPEETKIKLKNASSIANASNRLWKMK